MPRKATTEAEGAPSGPASAIEYTVIKSRQRRRTLSLSVDTDGRVLVRAPMRTTRAQVAELVQRHAAWIAKRRAEIASRPPAPSLAEGESLPYLGRHLRLVVENGPIAGPWANLQTGQLLVAIPGDTGSAAREVELRPLVLGWYVAEAAERIGFAVTRWAEEMGLEPRAVAVRNQRRLWGSCSSRDAMLRFNWRLITAPAAALDYVVVHELAHLRVPNHSTDFWAEVAGFMPDYAERRAQLKKVDPGWTI